MKNYRLIWKCSALVTLILAIIANVLFNLLPNFLYGFHSFFGYDLFGLYARVNAFYYRNIPIYLTNAYGDFELYPPGFHAFLASIKLLTNFDTFQLDVCFRVVFMILLVLLIFIIANRVGRVYTVSALSVSLIFLLSINISSMGYTVLGSITQASTISLSYILTLAAIFAMICLFSQEERGKKDIPYYVIFFLTFTAHGISHVGGMVMEAFLIGSTILFLMLYHLIFGENRQFITKSINLISISFLSFAFQFVIHWWKVLNFLSLEGKSSDKIKWYFGVEVPSPLLSNLWLLVLLLLVAALVIFSLSKVLSREHAHYKPELLLKAGNLLRRHSIIIYAAYVAVYVYGIIESESIVREVLGQTGTSFPFTMHFGPPYSLSTVSTQIFGLLLYILSFLGVVFFLKQDNIQAKLVGWTYLCAYFISFMSLFFMFMHPSRVIYCLRMFYSFAIAGGILYLWEFAGRLPLIRASGRRKTYAAVVCGIIILSLAFVHVVTLINKEPSLREHDFPKSLSILKFGVANPTCVDYELIRFINMQVEQNSHIIATPSTQKILVSVTSIAPVSVGYSESQEPYLRYVETLHALRLDGKDFMSYTEKYNVTHAVLLPIDLYNPKATRDIGFSGESLQEYYDSKSSKIYVSPHGAGLYWINASF